MSITDELRKYVQSWRETPNLMDDLDAGDIDGLLGDFEHIADRIDAEHDLKDLQAENEKLRKYAKLMHSHIKECCNACGERSICDVDALTRSLGIEVE